MASIRKYDFRLPANGSQYIPASGVYFRLITVSPSGNAINVTLSAGETAEQIIAGQGLKNVAFNALTLTNTTATVITGAILVSDGEFIDTNLGGTVDIGNFGANLYAADWLDAAGVVVAALGINAKRRYLLVQNKSDVPMFVTIDALSDPSMGQGLMLEPLQIWEPGTAPRTPVRLCCTDGPLFAHVVEG